VELHCYLPEELDETWAHLRHLGRRRAQLITSATASVQRIRDFLSVAWPAVTETCAQPFESVTWLAALQVVTSRCAADPGRLAAMGEEAFTALVRSAVGGWGGKKGWRAICVRVFDALTDTEGVVVSFRRGPCAGSLTSWATCSGPAPSCGPLRRTWPRCWMSSAFPGLLASPG